MLADEETRGVAHITEPARIRSFYNTDGVAVGKQLTGLPKGTALVEGKAGKSHQNERSLPLIQEPHFWGPIPQIHLHKGTDHGHEQAADQPQPTSQGPTTGDSLTPPRCRHQGCEQLPRCADPGGWLGCLYTEK